MNHITDLMTDIETLDVEPNSCILSIGSCVFNLLTGEIYASFSARASIKTNLLYDRTISADTLEFWFKESDEARSALFVDTKPLPEIIYDYISWIKNVNFATKPRHWANDPDFDLVILNSIIKKLGFEKLPFWSFQSVRTIVRAAANADEMVEKELKSLFKPRVKHDALEDAMAQAKLVSHCWNLLHP